MQAEHELELTVNGVTLAGNLAVPEGACGVVVFAHGTGSGRHSPRNQHVAGLLQDAGLATLLVDLLTAEEEREDSESGHLRFDTGFLAHRLSVVTDRLYEEPEISSLPPGYFGASTGAAAALIAAAQRPEEIGAVVSRGGRPDLAGEETLPRVQSPTMLIVGGEDHPVLETNRRSMDHLRAEKRLEIVPGATHLFEEPGALDEVARLAVEWFTSRLGGS